MSWPLFVRAFHWLGELLVLLGMVGLIGLFLFYLVTAYLKLLDQLFNLIGIKMEICHYIRKRRACTCGALKDMPGQTGLLRWCKKLRHIY
jgi:hypothetical protein